MTWFYFLNCSDDFIEYEEIKNFLNVLTVQGNVEQWMHLFEKSFLIKSGLTARRIGSLLLEFVKKNNETKKAPGYYFITEVADDRQGWMAKAAWDLINEPATVNVTPPALTSNNE